MTDIVKELRAQAAYLIEFRVDGPLAYGNVGAEVPALWLRAADEIEAMRKGMIPLSLLEHANRYQWLRQHGSCPFAETDEAWESPGKLDAEIDALIRAGR